MEEIKREKLENFFAQFKTLEYQKAEVLLRADDVPQGVYYLKNGYVRLYSISGSGREITLNIFKPGSYFPMMWAFSNIKNTYYFQAMTHVEVLRAPREDMMDFISKNPDILFELTNRILIGMNGLLMHIEQLFSGKASQKIIAMLLILAKRFGEKKDNENILIGLPLTHQDIANLSGLTRETVSAEMKKLQQKEILDYQKHQIVISDVRILEEELMLDKDEEPFPHIL